MGGVQSRQQMIERFNKINPKKWDVVRVDGMTQIATDQNQRQGQVNYINLDPRKKPEDELEVYYYRRSYDGPLVKCYGAQVVKSNSIGVCGAQNSMRVITERIIKRWIQLPKLTLPQIFYALTQALHGYSTLFKQVGAFQVNHNMLGINKQGQLHVWLNQNFAQNSPELEKGILYTTSTGQEQKMDLQTQMIQDVLRLIQNKCQNGSYPPGFRSKVFSNDMNFWDTRKDVDDYIKENKIQVPDRLATDKKMTSSRSKGMFVTQLSNSRIKKQQNPQTSPAITSQNKKLQLLNTPNTDKKTLINTLTNNQQITYQTKIIKNDIKQPLMTPKNQRYSIQNQNQQGYYTGGSISKDNITNYNFNDLRSNPNINATQSIYQPNASPQTDKYNQVNVNSNINSSFGYQENKGNTGGSGKKVNITYTGGGPITTSYNTVTTVMNPIPTTPTTTANPTTTTTTTTNPTTTITNTTANTQLKTNPIPQSSTSTSAYNTYNNYSYNVPSSSINSNYLISKQTTTFNKTIDPVIDNKNYITTYTTGPYTTTTAGTITGSNVNTNQNITNTTNIYSTGTYPTGTYTYTTTGIPTTTTTTTTTNNIIGPYKPSTDYKGAKITFTTGGTYTAGSTINTNTNTNTGNVNVSTNPEITKIEDNKNNTFETSQVTKQF